MPASSYCAQCGALNQPQATTCFACGRSLTEPAPPAADARRLIHGRYRLSRQLGVGGFGAVYQAEDTALGHRLVALKEMSPRGLKPDEAREATEAFQREALLLAGLAHPSLPRIYERFEEEGRWYLVMDFIAGETLEVYLDKQGGSLPVKEALNLALQLSEVLGYLHRRQPPIIFRDLKPSNVIRAPDGQLVLVDFGIARLFKPGQSKDTIAFGSPGYAAPEQYGKAQTTPRSDVFSLGALLHQMLTGIDPSEKPFRFAPLTMPRPAGLSALIERMVDMDESKRPPSMESVQRELERLLDGRAPWSANDLALSGASLSPARVATGAQAATSPVVQAASYSAPVQSWQGNTPPQPAAKKRSGLGWVIMTLIALFAIFFGVPALSSIHSSGIEVQGANTGPSGSNGATAVPVYALAWSPDDRYIASAGGDNKVQIWTVDSGQPMVTLVTNASKTTELAWSPDSKYLASLDNGVIDLWDANTEAFYIDAYQPPTSISAFAWSPASDQLAVALDNGTVHLVNVTTKADALLYTGQPGTTNVIAWSPDGKYIATGGQRYKVDVWQSETGQIAYTNQGYAGDISAIAWSPDSQRIVAVDNAGTMHVWDALTGNHPFVHLSDVNAVAWSPNGNYIATGDQWGAVQVWSPGYAAPLYTYNRSAAVRAVAWSPDSKRIASASLDGTVKIWDALTGQNGVTYQQP
jgi:serine/threonine protein kinase